MSVADPPPIWIDDGEKYGLIGLAVQVEQPIPLRQVAPGLWAWTTNGALPIPDHWREWLGTIRAGEIEGSNLILLCKMQSSAPDILDAENQQLERRIRAFYRGLLLSSTFTPAHNPILLTGARRDGVVDVRQESSFDAPSLNLFRHYSPILLGEIERAASLAASYQTLTATPPPGGAWRIFRSLSVYCDARSLRDILDRLHQYCRCIEGLIFSDHGKGKRQFKCRTELFIGPREHPLMEQLYAIRSDIEHLHEHKYLENYDRNVRLDLVQKEAIAEHIARNALAHIIDTPGLWPVFGNTGTLGPFWQLQPADRQAIWGPPTIRVADALVGYDPQHVTDSALGRP
jgi:hypothetical protein